MYKSKLIVALLLFGITLTSYSQNPINIYANGNASFLGGKFIKDFDLDSKIKPGFGIGFSLDDQITERITIESGVGFSVKNYELEPDFNYSSHFISVSVIGKYKFQDFYFLLGPELNIAVYTNINANSLEENISKYVNVATVGPTVGLGFNLNDQSSIYAKYQHSFVDYLKDVRKMYSRTIEFGIKKRIRD
jgi:hypothetical protein